MVLCAGLVVTEGAEDGKAKEFPELNHKPSKVSGTHNYVSYIVHWLIEKQQ